MGMTVTCYKGGSAILAHGGRRLHPIVIQDDRGIFICGDDVPLPFVPWRHWAQRPDPPLTSLDHRRNDMFKVFAGTVHQGPYS